MEDGLLGDNMVFITAEIGINHNGSLKIAKKLIDVAKDEGCDAVKFQKRTIEKDMTISHDIMTVTSCHDS